MNKFYDAGKFIAVRTDDENVMNQYLGAGNWEPYRVYCVHMMSYYDDLRSDERQECKAFYDMLDEASRRANPEGTPLSEWTHWVNLSYVSGLIP